MGKQGLLYSRNHTLSLCNIKSLSVIMESVYIRRVIILQQSNILYHCNCMTLTEKLKNIRSSSYKFTPIRYLQDRRTG